MQYVQEVDPKKERERVIQNINRKGSKKED